MFELILQLDESMLAAIEVGQSLVIADFVCQSLSRYVLLMFFLQRQSFSLSDFVTK